MTYSIISHFPMHFSWLQLYTQALSDELSDRPSETAITLLETRKYLLKEECTCSSSVTCLTSWLILIIPIPYPLNLWYAYFYRTLWQHGLATLWWTTPRTMFHFLWSIFIQGPFTLVWFFSFWQWLVYNDAAGVLSLALPLLDATSTTLERPWLCLCIWII